MIRTRFRSSAIASPARLNSLACLKRTQSWSKVSRLNCVRRWIILKVPSTAKAPPRRMAPPPVPCCGPNGIAANMAVPLPRRPWNVNCASIAHRLSSFRWARISSRAIPNICAGSSCNCWMQAWCRSLPRKRITAKRMSASTATWRCSPLNMTFPSGIFGRRSPTCPTADFTHGMIVRCRDDIYLTEEATVRHRMTGLAALNVVWRAVAGNELTTKTPECGAAACSSLRSD